MKPWKTLSPTVVRAGIERFTQKDPIGLAGSANLHGFADGGPANFSDPFGLLVCPP